MDLSKSQLKIAFKQLAHLLSDEEEVECAAVARNASNTLYIKPCLLATDRRLIYLEPALLGLQSKARFLYYEEIASIFLEEGWFTSKISIAPLSGKGVPIVQDHLEKTRSRELVDFVNSQLENQSPQALPERIDTEDPLVIKLAQLKQLYDEGIITEAEFAAKKAEVLKDL